MKNLKQNKFHLFLFIVSIFLLFIIFKWIHYLVTNNYIVECFQQKYSSSNPININNVNIPLTTSYSCNNFCNTTARCSITGQQCVADNDCPGCQPYVPPSQKNKQNMQVPGDNDAGKISVGVANPYSTLTTDIGTQAAFFNEYNYAKPPPEANFGANTWLDKSNQLNNLYNNRYVLSSKIEYLPNYSNTYSTTGKFLNTEPLAANAYLTIK